MRTLEAALGLLIMIAAGLLAGGAASILAPVAPAGLGVTLALAGAGATIAAHGMTGRAAQRSSPVSARRWRALFYVLLVLTLAATLPLAVELLDLVSIAGFPFGYYLAAQGLLILFAMLAFRAAFHLEGTEPDATEMTTAGDA
ncbi:MAG: sodium/substrate symporter small subunit [Deltaproteobacteria bacterium]